MIICQARQEHFRSRATKAAKFSQQKVMDVSGPPWTIFLFRTITNAPHSLWVACWQSSASNTPLTSFDCVILLITRKIIILRLILIRSAFGSVRSAVGRTAGYGTDDGEVGVRVPMGSRIFTSSYRPDRFWGPPGLLSNGYSGLFPRE
jgi:hypothetical protein